MTDTWKWTISILGMIGSAMALVCLIRRGFGIGVVGLPAAILAEYERFRDFIFSIVPFHLPRWAKDYIVCHLMIGAAGLRADAMIGRSGPISDSVWTVLGWPLAIAEIVLEARQKGTDWEQVLYWAWALGIIVAAAAFFFTWNHLIK